VSSLALTLFVLIFASAFFDSSWSRNFARRLSKTEKEIRNTCLLEPCCIILTQGFLNKFLLFL
jgi:hypothetical protein